jgi:RHS repeat-associated protein
MKKTISGTTTQFLYDGLNPVQELNSSNAVVANLLTGLRVDEYFTRTDTATGVMSTLLADALGSTIGLVGSGGTIATSYTYQPFGATTAGGPGNTNTYQFTGRENDGTGLDYYRTRYYSPTFQRFIAQDPIGFDAGDANLYGYTFNSPTNLKDPSGKILPILIAGGLIGGGAAAYSNYGAYESGTITGGQYAEAIAFGAATGVLTSLTPGLYGSILAGALGGGLTSLIDQRLAKPCGDLNLAAVGVNGVLGGVGGALAVGAGALGDQIIININPIGELAGTPATTLETEFGIGGGAVGTGISLIFGP